jgi:CheY-like chemotaxis protein
MSQYQLGNIKVLIIDDNAPLIQLLRSVLNTFGVYNIEVAADGKEGFSRFCKHNHDLVIADWMMEPVDGIELTHIIRNDPSCPNRFVPVVLMTGFSQKSRVEEARDAGVTEFLVKPFSAHDLYKRLSHIIENPRQFVKSEDFFGPDRRRRKSASYKGVPRRIEDAPINESAAGDEDFFYVGKDVE